MACINLVRSTAHRPHTVAESHSSSSNLTSSDKLTALPTQSTPVLDRLKTFTRGGRRGTDASLTSIDSASGSLHALHSLPDATRQSESDSSVAKDTPRARNESGRSLPGSFQNVRAGEYHAFRRPLASFRAFLLRSLLLYLHAAGVRGLPFLCP